MKPRSCGYTVLMTGLVFATTASPGFGQDRDTLQAVPTHQPQAIAPKTDSSFTVDDSATDFRGGDFGLGNGLFTGTRDFPNFIGFISNPIQSIDPRSQNNFWPVFASGWASGNSPHLPDADMQVYGAGLTVAVTDRLSMGLNQGGYAVIDISGQQERLLRKLGLPVPDRDLGGQREGWLNLGGFLQYTVIADVPNQFLLTAGLRWEAPSGAEQVFQGGSSPAYLAPYLTAGKECGCWHFLATAGYEFPAGSGQATTETYYLNLHVDRQIDWFYPLVEMNGSYQSHNINLGLPARHGIIDLGGFSASDSILSIAVGANAVLIPGKLEFGAVYILPITAEDRFDFNAFLVKLTYHF